MERTYSQQIFTKIMKFTKQSNQSSQSRLLHIYCIMIVCSMFLSTTFLKSKFESYNQIITGVQLKSNKSSYGLQNQVWIMFNQIHNSNQFNSICLCVLIANISSGDQLEFDICDQKLLNIFNLECIENITVSIENYIDIIHHFK
ncbi:unnamed protein product [Paramecium octaurelia]|uniref:Transmembrane protein n=1 Tax=Paramecium octaurelia TaxID=43137 RepID=A0A8S1Y1T1_PAROT|nr:unnamed protein product [Paramecium octaurelia]